jgi:hypothetical protein
MGEDRQTAQSYAYTTFVKPHEAPKRVRWAQTLTTAAEERLLV